MLAGRTSALQIPDENVHASSQRGGSRACLVLDRETRSVPERQSMSSNLSASHSPLRNPQRAARSRNVKSRVAQPARFGLVHGSKQRHYLLPRHRAGQLCETVRGRVCLFELAETWGVRPLYKKFETLRISRLQNTNRKTHAQNTPLVGILPLRFPFSL